MGCSIAGPSMACRGARRSRLFLRMEATEEYDLVPISRALSHAVSNRLAPWVLARRRMPIQERKPPDHVRGRLCSGCGRLRMMTSTRVSVLRPTAEARLRMRAGVQLA